jgi:uncharacterized membrane protein
VDPAQHPTTVPVLRGAALGLAAGARASLGVLGPALAGRHGLRVAGAMTAFELVADKLPFAPSRLAPSQLAPRLAVGMVGAAALAVRGGRSPWAPALAGLAGAAAGSVVGSAWRAAAQDRGWTWQAALAEDAVAGVLVAVAAGSGS